MTCHSGSAAPASTVSAASARRHVAANAPPSPASGDATTPLAMLTAPSNAWRSPTVRSWAATQRGVFRARLDHRDHGIAAGHQGQLKTVSGLLAIFPQPQQLSIETGGFILGALDLLAPAVIRVKARAFAAFVEDAIIHHSLPE